MVGQSLWKNLKKVVLLDKKIETVKENIKNCSSLLEKDLKTIPQYKADIENIKAKFHEAKHELNLIELNAKELKDLEDKKKEQLDTQQKSSGYQYLEKEIRTIKQKRSLIDNSLLATWHKVEELEKKVSTVQTEKNNSIIQLEEGLQKQKEELEVLKKDLENLEKERAEAFKIIPEEWQIKYDRMKNRVPDPIVPVVGTACSACYYSLLRQDLLELKKASVLPCRNCYRLLYFDQEEETELNKASF